MVVTPPRDPRRKHKRAAALSKATPLADLCSVCLNTMPVPSARERVLDFLQHEGDCLMLPLLLFRQGDAWKRTVYHCGRSLLALVFAGVQEGARGEGARPSLPISMHPVTTNVVPHSTSSLTSLRYAARNLPIPNLRPEQLDASPQSERRLQYLIKSPRTLRGYPSLP